MAIRTTHPQAAGIANIVGPEKVVMRLRLPELAKNGEEGMEQAEPENNGLAHPLAEVPRGGGQEQVDLVAHEAFPKATHQPVITFQMPNDRFDACSPPEAFPHALALRAALACRGRLRR